MLHSGWLIGALAARQFLALSGSQTFSYDGATHGLDEPELGVILGDTLELADGRPAVLAVGDTGAVTAQHDVEVHTENTSLGVVLNSEVDVFVNAKAEIAYVIIKLKS